MRARNVVIDVLMICKATKHRPCHTTQELTLRGLRAHGANRVHSDGLSPADAASAAADVTLHGPDELAISATPNGREGER